MEARRSIRARFTRAFPLFPAFSLVLLTQDPPANAKCGSTWPFSSWETSVLVFTMPSSSVPRILSMTITMTAKTTTCTMSERHREQGRERGKSGHERHLSLGRVPGSDIPSSQDFRWSVPLTWSPSLLWCETLALYTHVNETSTR